MSTFEEYYDNNNEFDDDDFTRSLYEFFEQISYPSYSSLFFKPFEISKEMLGIRKDKDFLKSLINSPNYEIQYIHETIEESFKFILNTLCLSLYIPIHILHKAMKINSKIENKSFIYYSMDLALNYSDNDKIYKNLFELSLELSKRYNLNEIDQNKTIRNYLEKNLSKSKLKELKYIQRFTEYINIASRIALTNISIIKHKIYLATRFSFEIEEMKKIEGINFHSFDDLLYIDDKEFIDKYNLIFKAHEKWYKKMCKMD